MGKPSIILVLFALTAVSALWKPAPRPSVKHTESTAVDPPVFVTPFLPGNADQARALAKVNGPQDWTGENYAGFITIDTPADSNMFFWFHKSLDGNPDAPILLWLQGGPGVSSMFGQFTEIGPFNIDSSMKVAPNKMTWNKNFHLLFIDNPIGAGFSFTHDRRAFVTNQTTVGENLYKALTQFFQLFPSLQKNDFYVTGESYAGKYIPACAYTIHTHNPGAATKINLKGIAIGDGAMHPPSQFRGFGELLYYLGMVTDNERRRFGQYEDQMKQLLSKGDNVGAFRVFDEMLNGDFYEFGTYYANVTGMGSNYFNFEQGPDGSSLTENYFIDWLATEEGKNAAHVGNYPFSVYNSTVEENLIGDWMVGVVDFLVPLLEKYKVLIYSGQNDIILGPPLTENFLRALQWSGQSAFLSAAKKVWWVPTADPDQPDLGGYARTVKNFVQVVVRGAGHMVPGDQPERAFDMIDRFINDRPF